MGEPYAPAGLRPIRSPEGGQGQPCYDADFYPFGGERNYLNNCPQNCKFTGQERDSESGLDYFLARHHASNLGRFLQVDPSMGSVVLRTPQSWNRYTYTINNPLRYIDLFGDLWVSSRNANDPYTWADECTRNQTCFETVSAVIDGQLRIYGSQDSSDITSFAVNQSGYIDLNQLEQHADAQFEVVAQNETFASAADAASIFNIAQSYHSQYPSDARITITSAALKNGTAEDPHQASHGRPNAALDFRYMGENGQPLIGVTAAANASPARNRALFGLFRRAGFTQAVSARPRDFGTGPQNRGPRGRALMQQHQNHGHAGRVIQRERPPRR